MVYVNDIQKEVYMYETYVMRSSKLLLHGRGIVWLDFLQNCSSVEVSEINTRTDISASTGVLEIQVNG